MANSLNDPYSGSVVLRGIEIELDSDIGTRATCTALHWPAPSAVGMWRSAARLIKKIVFLTPAGYNKPAPA
jgi:hypothetical protein